MAKQAQAEGNYLEFTAPTGGVTKDVGVKIGDILVIAQTTQLATEKFIGQRIGVVEHAKLSAQAWTEGQQVNWDDTNKRFTTVTTGNFKAGVAARAAANPSSTGFVLLSGVSLGAALA
jgi:predicted RecA/RadA family phage recombinase